ncbi:hypothetical protein PR003_g836 [Phytophthora rubi]|uniref:Uncharacterized protein n=1 Tax=Phytophthora rubi TaxID=129364 RepID=A0A6A4FXD3_9STRA|nr:hypothetical protein PR003_g836 [Phytophthora rubi]
MICLATCLAICLANYRATCRATCRSSILAAYRPKRQVVYRSSPPADILLALQ